MGRIAWRGHQPAVSRRQIIVGHLARLDRAMFKERIYKSRNRGSAGKIRPAQEHTDSGGISDHSFADAGLDSRTDPLSQARHSTAAPATPATVHAGGEMCYHFGRGFRRQ